MKGIQWLALFVTLTVGIPGNTPAATAKDHPDLDYASVVVRVSVSDRDTIDKLAAWKEPWTVDLHKGFVLVDVTASERDWLLEQGYRVEIDMRRTAEWNRVFERGPAQRAGIPGFACYRTVGETLTSGAALAAAYPQLATWTDIGDSWEKTSLLGGQDIWVLKLTNSAMAGPKPKLMALGAVHAREYATAELVTRFAEYLLANYELDADIHWLLDHHEIHLVLHANPDGRAQAETGLLWRKNTNQNYCSPTSTTRGADLNRNYPYWWGAGGGSSGSECATTYRGPSPESEPETQAVTNYARSIFPDQRGPALTDAAPADATGVFIDVHSFGEVMLWSWGFSATPAPNGDALGTFARKFSSFNGYSSIQALSGSTDGTTKDFGYGELGLASYTLEIGTTFFQDCGYFESSILAGNLDALRYAAKVARTPFMTPYGPDARDLALSSAVVASGASFTLDATADDTAYDNSVDTQPTQNIATAEYYLDVPPWQAGATAVAMAAADGAFDAKIEGVTAAVDTAGLADGRHIVFVRARDVDGDWGPPTAEFFYVLDTATAPRVAGTVRALGTGAPLAATVAATAALATSTDPATGRYELLLPPGTYDIEVTPDAGDYAATTLAGVVATTSAVTPADFLLDPFCSVFTDDVETGNAAGWLADPGWQITTELANSPTHSWTDSAGGNYPNNSDIFLTSPAVSLAGFSAARLEFAQVCDTEATYDFCIVQTSADGGAWQEVTRFDGSSSTWDDVSLALPGLDGSGNARFRFWFSSDFSITQDGWHIDDVTLRAAGPACTGPDGDADGIDDAFDNCSAVVNPAQRDTDGDGFGNLCDADIAPASNDCGIDFLDLGALKAAFFANDAAPNWNADADFNDDGVVDFLDLGQMKAAFFGTPGPSGTASCPP